MTAIQLSPRIRKVCCVGILPSDSDSLCLSKSVVLFAALLFGLGSLVWSLFYWVYNYDYPVYVSFSYLFLFILSLFVYVRWDSFDFFLYVQLFLMLFFPFVAQWSIGNSITGFALFLWALLSPLLAILSLGSRESLPWFLGFMILLVFSCLDDLYSFSTMSKLYNETVIGFHTTVIFSMLNFSVLSAFVYALVRFSEQEKQRLQQQMEKTNRLLETEQDRSEKLLLNVLPPAVAQRLKYQDSVLAEGFPSAAIMFADIVNFTKLAQNMTPDKVFSMLNVIFSNLDILSEHYGLEKIKTIGDAYMIAGGLVGSHPGYLYNMIMMALDIHEFADYYTRETGTDLKMRIGVATGPVSAGVVGSSKFIYDVWGDTVNLADRLTSECPPGMILVDARTRILLRHKVHFEGPDTVSLKGKGETMAYRVVAPNKTLV